MGCGRISVRVFLSCSVFVIMLCSLLHLLIKNNSGTTWSLLQSSSDSRADQMKYKYRRSTLIDTCAGKEREYRGNGHVDRLLAVDNKHSLVYCPVPKIASSFWKRVFQVSSEVKVGLSPFDITGAHDNSLPTLNSTPFDVSHWTLNNYTKFLFVREPYSRLLACYIDKFFTTNPDFWKIGRLMVEQFRPSATEMARSCGHDVTFPEFIKFVIYTLETREHIDEHWQPIFERCSPCQIQYDIIGKLETVSTDLDYMLINYMSGDVLIEEMETQNEREQLNKNAKGLMSRYDDVAQRCMPLEEHLLRFIRKEQIRGIISKSVELPNQLLHKNKISVGDLKEFIFKAYERKDFKKDKKLNRMEALLEAYSDVPLEDMAKLQTLYKPDFELFGYDLRPDDLFNEQIRKRIKKFYLKV